MEVLKFRNHRLTAESMPLARPVRFTLRPALVALSVTKVRALYNAVTTPPRIPEGEG